MRQKGTSRRAFLGGALVAGSLAGMRFAPREAFAQTEFSPEEALKELMEGNRRFVSGRMTAPAHDLELLRTNAAEKQEPFAAVLCCADSRAPVELIFDQSIGHVFVCRIAGNITTPEIIASLEDGAAVLGTRAILVLGHSNCGAVSATIKGHAVPGQISALYARIRPAVDEAGPHLEAATRANAKMHATLLREASPVIAGLVREKKIQVVAGYYDVSRGAVTLVD
ncbi:MAG TPA: carbonic anhydrase [Terriglobia bacterium]|nr:carbonic anhydrase [Terriglobia bacterium]